MSKLKNVFKRGDAPILYLSGRHGVTPKLEKVWLKRTGCTHRCFSFAYVGKVGDDRAFYQKDQMTAAMQVNIDKGLGIMMDSGAFSFHRFVASHSGAISNKKKQKFTDVELLREETVDLYTRYVKKESKNWDFYVNFDYKIHSPTIYEMQHYLEEKHKMKPVPVFHGDDGTDWLKKYIDEGHRLIGIGCPMMLRRRWKDKRYFFDQVFNITEKHGVNLHGLAVTSLNLMFAYPWFSVDSATWVKSSAYGHILAVDPMMHVIHNIHVSTRESTQQLDSYNRMSPQAQKEVRRQVEDNGFDFDLVRRDLEERCNYNGWIFSHINQYKDLVAKDNKVAWEKLL